MIIYLLILFFVTLSLAEVSLVIYYFQIKEYRFDRLISYLKEKEILFFILPERFYLPKKSVRNRNIVLICGVLASSYFLILIYFAHSYVAQIVMLLLSPIFNIFTVIIGVLYTGGIVKRKRGYVIDEAIKKVQESKTIFIGITGSFGKTSTKEFLYKTLSPNFRVAKTDENQNTDIGIAMSINSNLKEDTEYFIFEVGAYKIGEIEKVVSWIKPKYGILTGLGNQHFSLFGSRDNLIKAKSELLNILPKDGAAYVNKDCNGYKESTKGVVSKVCLYSTKDTQANVYLKKYKKSDVGSFSNVTISCGNEDIRFKTGLLGKHIIANILPCVALALDIGVEEGTLQKSLEELEQVHGRLSLHKGINGASFLNDSYSSNVEGFLSALDVLGDCKAINKLVVTKGIIELGRDKEASYKRILDLANDRGVRVITTDRALKNLDDRNTVFLFRNENKIFEYLKNEVGTEDLILIEGRFSDKFLSKLDLK